jgi:hypothetical protein
MSSGLSSKLQVVNRTVQVGEAEEEVASYWGAHSPRGPILAGPIHIWRALPSQPHILMLVLRAVVAPAAWLSPPGQAGAGNTIIHSHLVYSCFLQIAAAARTQPGLSATCTVAAVFGRMTCLLGSTAAAVSLAVDFTPEPPGRGNGFNEGRRLRQLLCSRGVCLRNGGRSFVEHRT